MLTYQIGQTTFDALSDDIKKEYKPENGKFVLDVKGVEFHPDVQALKSAKDNEVTKAAQAVADLNTLKGEKDSLQSKYDLMVSKEPDESKLAALRKEYDAKLEAKDVEINNAKSEFSDYKSETTLSSKATEIADRLLKKDTPAFTKKAFIADMLNRMSLERPEGSDKDLIRISHSDGSPSAASLVDFEKELLDNKEYGSILAGSKASGSTETIDTPGGTKTPGSPQTKSLLEMSDAELLAATEFKTD